MRTIVLLTCLWLAFSVTVSPGVQPTPGNSASAEDMRAAFSSPEALNQFLEARWPVTAIRTFCIPERRPGFTRAVQLLVPRGIVWRGELFKGQETGFDRIEWYANVRDGEAFEYSLEAKRGEDFWLLDGGSQATAQNPPNYSPDPTRPGFYGHLVLLNKTRLMKKTNLSVRLMAIGGMYSVGSVIQMLVLRRKPPALRVKPMKYAIGATTAILGLTLMASGVYFDFHWWAVVTFALMLAAVTFLQLRSIRIAPGTK